jgi:serine/threonine protein kinase
MTKVPLKAQKIKDLLKDVCRGMAYLHGFEPPILHRDLKPANLLVTKSLQVKICDFGLSEQKLLEAETTTQQEAAEKDDGGNADQDGGGGADADEDEDDPQEDQLGGTAPYSAPEVLLGKELDVGCDVFSFGVIVWEMFTRRRPWDNVHAARISQVVGFDDERLEMSEEVEGLADVKAMIEDCWQLKPSDRPKFPALIDTIDAAECGAGS